MTNQKIRLVHSFSTCDTTSELLRLHTYYFTLSAIYAKRSGFSIVLHTDSKGASLLKHAPYDKIIIDLDTCSKPAPRIYAWPKFEAMRNEAPGAIHIDGDVFLKRSSLQNLLSLGDYDLIVQSIEQKGVDNWGWLWNESTIAFARCEYPSWMRRDCLAMYNCGVVGFKNKAIQEEYRKYYLALTSEYAKVGIDLNSVPDLIAEQQLLYDFAKHKKLKVKTLLDFPKLTESADKIGYQHIIGCSKSIFFEKCKQKIKKFNREIFNALEETKWEA